MRTRKITIQMIVIKIIKKIVLITIVLSFFYNMMYCAFSSFNPDKKFSILGKYFIIVEDNLMSPELSKNDLIITKKCESSELKVGDVILFNRNERLLFSRITKKNKDDSYTIKGDNNNYYDLQPVSYELVQGKVSKNIKGFGVILKIISSKVVTVVGILYLILLYTSIVEKKKKDMRRRKKAMKLNNKIEY